MFATFGHFYPSQEVSSIIRRPKKNKISNNVNPFNLQKGIFFKKTKYKCSQQTKSAFFNNPMLGDYNEINLNKQKTDEASKCHNS